MLVQKLCMEEEVGFVDLWRSFVGRADMYIDKKNEHNITNNVLKFADDTKLFRKGNTDGDNKITKRSRQISEMV